MASRERKRAERRKRKERGLERRAEIAERYEERNREAREELEPLETGERPLIVSVGAVLSALICLSIIGAYVAGAEVNGERPRVLQVVAPAILMGVMAVGMWRVRYWAVLGFEAVLGLLLVAAVLGLTSAGSGVQLAGNLVLIAISGALFFFMIKAMARIQMPERKPPT
jgi:peptidoglycan/LPS O-acetylase OafA/YrhL